MEADGEYQMVSGQLVFLRPLKPATLRNPDAPDSRDVMRWSQEGVGLGEIIRRLKLQRAKQRQQKLMRDFPRPPVSAFEHVPTPASEQQAQEIEQSAPLGSLLRTVGQRRRSGRLQDQRGAEELQRELERRLIATQLKK